MIRQCKRRSLCCSFAVLLCSVGVLLIGASAAAAAEHRAASARVPASVMPTLGSHLPRPAVSTSTGPSPLSSGVGECNNVPTPELAMCDLVYQPEEGSVMLTNTTHLVLWAPPGYTYPAGYVSLVERYLSDVAEDSGDPTNTNSVSTQYYQVNHEVVPGLTQYIEYKSTYAGALSDTYAYPPAACPGLEGAATTCLEQEQEEGELAYFLYKSHAPLGPNDLYIVLLPPNVQTCLDDFLDCGPYGGGEPNGTGEAPEYCGYHSYTIPEVTGIAAQPWVNLPYVPAAYCAPSLHPNNNDADDTINVLSHEMNESITDPLLNAWYDDENVNGPNGGEEADQCASKFGPALGYTPTGSYDELINRDPYNVQMLWSNASHGCVMNYGAAAPTAAFSYTSEAGDQVNFDGDGSRSHDSGGYIIRYSWEFGDGGTGSGAAPSHKYASSGTYTVKLTVTDDAGLTSETSQVVTVPGPPEATIESPEGAETYIKGEVVNTKFSCKDGAYGSGVNSCEDSNGASGTSGKLNTSTLGEHEYTVTATSKDGQKGRASIKYEVVEALCTSNTGTLSLTPGLTRAPALQTLKVEGTLSGCTGEAFRWVKYTATLKTPAPVSCLALKAAGEPAVGAASYAWALRARASRGTLGLPLSETLGVALTGTVASGPYSPLTVDGTVRESYSMSSRCGIPFGKVPVRVTKGRFTGTGVAFE